jgi:PAS domain S-box-containing protein
MTFHAGISFRAASPPKSSIVRQTLRKIAARISLVVVIATVLSYWHVRTSFEHEALENLERYVAQRQVRESAIFDLASGNVRTFAEAFRREIRQADPQEAEQRFASLFETRPDGTTRLTEDVFRIYGMTGFIGKHVLIDRDLKRRLVVAFDLVTQLGPAWASHFTNLYAVTPEGAVIMYWPGQPWALKASDWEISGKLNLLTDDADAVMVAGAGLPRSPDEERWSELYFDYGANDWLVSVTRPVDSDGHQLVRVGQDILMHDLIGRAVASDLKGTYNLLFSDAGRLIAHPRFMEAIQARSGSLAIAETGDPHLEQIHQLAIARAPTETVMRNEPYDEIVAISRFAGPRWTLATIFPLSIAADNAWQSARIVLVMGAVALAIELLILSSTLKTQIAVPMRHLVRATGSVAAGRFGTHLDVRRDDEIGELAQAFTDMTQQVKARETALNERTASLARLNEQLAHELEERQRTERELAHHRELNALLDAIDYGILFLDPDLKVRIANRAYKEMWNVPDAMVAGGTDIRDLIVQERDDADVARDVESLLRCDEALVEMRRPDGRVFRYRCVPLPDGGRMLTYFDITGLKQIETALRRHLAAMETAMDGMAILTPEGTYEYINAAYLRIHGYDRTSDLVGRSWRHLYSREERQRLDSEGLSALIREGRWSGEAVGLRRDRTAFPQDVSLTRMQDGGLICVVRDITERRARDEALREAKQHAEDASRAKSQFLANMSHELRTPLNAVLGYSELLMDGVYGPLPENAEGVLARVQANGRHLLSLINDVLDLSKIEAGELDVAAEPYSVAELVEAAISSTEALATAKGLTLTASVPEGLSAGHGDARRLTQVLLNLVGNAIKFTAAGSVEIAARVANGRLRIAVSDTGIGISPADLDRIFGNFQQGSNTMVEGYGGTGLGLAISKRIVEMHGGSIEVCSEVGRGTTFTIDLPAAPDSLKEAA